MMRQQTTTFEAPPHTAARWPDAVGFREAIQNPNAVLSDPDLQAAEVVLDRRGLPLAYSGRFAVVFRLRASGGDWAIRCFTQAANDGERRERYRAIAERLAATHAAHFVPFRYIERGIRIGAQWFPIVAMRWAEGETLGRWVEKNQNDPGALRRLCSALTRLLTDLESAGIAHGDWQHDNLLVSNDGAKITLVDYDGMFVPALSGRAALELGHPNYQHPNRDAGDFAPGLDRFSCLALQTALLGLARDPSLWSRFNDGESILFKRGDFDDPGLSPVFRALRALAGTDASLRERLTLLENACRAGRNGVFLSSESLAFSAGSEAGDGSAKWWLPAGESAPPAQQSVPRPADSVGRYLRRLDEQAVLDAEEENFRQARFLWLTALFWGPLLLVLSSALLGFWPIGAVLCWCFLRLPYTAWPRNQIREELSREISKLGALIGVRQDRSVTLLEIERLERDLHRFEAEWTKLEQDREAFPEFSREYDGLSEEILKVGRLIEERAAGLAAERGSSGQNGGAVPPEQVRVQVEALEREIGAFEAEREKLLWESAAFPEVSFRAYCRKILGFKEGLKRV